MGKSTYKVTLWRVGVTIVAVETQQCTVCVLELHITVNYIKMLYCTAMPLRQIYVACENETYVDLDVKCPMLH